MSQTVTAVLEVLAQLRSAIEGVDADKTLMHEPLRERLRDYQRVLERFNGCPAGTFQHELERLTEVFGCIEDLLINHTSKPADSRVEQPVKKTIGASQFALIAGFKLDEIDVEIFRQFSAMAAKAALDSAEILDLLRDLPKVRAFSSLEPLPSMAAVPSGPPALPASYVERSALLSSVVCNLTAANDYHAPCVLLGMGGSGKTVLASAVVRNEQVRQHFRNGIFWINVGYHGKKQLLALLRDLVKQMNGACVKSSRSTDQGLNSLDEVTRHLTAHGAEDTLPLDQVTRHLTALGAEATLPQLVVLDDVWDREVVDAVRLTGLEVLVTTRDLSVVPVEGGGTRVGNLEEEEAVQLLKLRSGAAAVPVEEAKQVHPRRTSQ